MERWVTENNDLLTPRARVSYEDTLEVTLG